MNTSLAKTLKVALLGCAVALGAVRTADAAYVVINADPQYGAQFPDLSWRAIGALYVPNVCLTVGQFANVFSNPQTFYFADFDPICGTSAIQSVQLEFYKTNTNAPVETLNIVNYIADSGSRNSIIDPLRDSLVGELNNITLLGGKLDGFETTLSKPVRALTQELGGGDYCFALEFSSKTARVESFSYDGTDCGALLPRDPKADEDYSTVANVYWNPNFRPSRLRDTPVPDFDDLPLIVQDVPEPASLALALAALAAAFGAGSVARRARS